MAASDRPHVRWQKQGGGRRPLYHVVVPNLLPHLTLILHKAEPQQVIYVR